MAFTKTPAGAANDFTLTGTPFEDITSIINADGVSVVAEGGNDDISIQNSTNSVTGYNVDMGDGNDRIQFIEDNAQIAQARAAFQNGTISTGNGDDIVFATDGGFIDRDRTASILYSSLLTGAGNDIARLYGAISSSVFMGADIDTLSLEDAEQNVQNRVDRFSGSNIQLGSGNDLLRVDTADTGVVDTTIQGGAGDDRFRSGAELGVANVVSGNWARTTVFGGTGSDRFFFADAAASLYLVGGGDADTINSGFGNDTVEGRGGADTIAITSGANSVLGQDGADIITILGNGDNTVFGGNAADAITITGEGNNFVQADDNTANAGGDTVTITGGGQNTVYGGDIADIITMNTDGFSYVFAGNGADVVNFAGDAGENGGGRAYLGNGHDVFTNTGASQDAVSVYGGAGHDIIDAGVAPFLIQAGTQGDRVSVTGASGGTIVQLDGESIAATDVVQGGVANTVWSDGDVITYNNGVDTVAGFVAGTNFLKTSLGDLGLDNNGNLFDALTGGVNGGGLEVNDGMVTGRTYFLAGTWSFNDTNTIQNDPEGSFTVGATGNDYLIVTQGNNAPLTANTNSMVLIGIGNGNITNINSNTII